MTTQKQPNSLTKIFLQAMLLSTLAIAVHAAAGDPDPSFGVNGTATDYLVSGATVNRVIVQPDGKIIVIGKRLLSIGLNEPAKDYLMVRRYNPDGTLETIFQTSLKQGVGFDAEVQPDGKVVVFGHAPNTFTSPFGAVITTTSPAVWRFHESGAIDTAFGSSGIKFINAQSGGNLHVEVASSYIFILYASRVPYLLGDYSYKLTRLSPGGGIDYSVTMPESYGTNYSIILKVDGATSDAVVLGANQLRRYNFDGSIDTGFGANGVASIPYCFSVPGLPMASKDLEIQPDGGLLVLRWYQYQNATASNLTRQNSNGTADPAVCKGTSHGPGVGTDLSLQPDGRFFFKGSSSTAIRYFADGTPATSVVNVGTNPQAITPDQKLVTARAVSGSLILTRQLLD